MIRSIACDMRIAARKHHVLLAVISFAILALLLRAFFGVDLMDESYYFTQVIRLLKGDRLLADIWDVTQTQGIPLLPFYWLYTKAFGYDGLILYGRILMLLLNLFTAVFLYAALSVPLRKTSAAWIALLSVTFAPFGLLTVSYNNMQQTWMLLGASMAFCALCRPDAKRASSWLLIAGGLAHALMFASYPASVAAAPVLLFMVFIGAYIKTKHWKKAFSALCRYGLGMAIAAISLALYVVFRVGIQESMYGIGHMLASPAMSYPSLTMWEQLKNVWLIVSEALGSWGMLAYSALTGLTLFCVGQNWMVGLASRIMNRRIYLICVVVIGCCLAALLLVANAQYQRYLLVLALAFLIADVFVRKRVRDVIWICVVCWVMVWPFCGRLYGSNNSVQLFSVILSAPLPLVLLTLQTPRDKTWQLVFLLLIPSLMITAIIMLFSSGFFSNARHGLFGAALCLLALLSIPSVAESGGGMAGDGFMRIFRRVSAVLVPAVALVTLLGLYFSHVFNDEPVTKLNAAVSFGPGKGLYTTAARCEELDGMALDLREQAVPDGKLLVLENCPYAYGICESMTPFTNSTWVASMYSRGSYEWIKDIYATSLFDYMAYRKAVPDVIFYYKPADFRYVADPDYPLHMFIQDKYDCVTIRDEYWIFRLRTAK